MNNDILVKVEGVSKKFCRDLKRSLFYGVKDISSELFGSKKNGQLRKDEFWAVDNVSFELKRGECLGLIGHNGAGKSTLLKLLNGLLKPDKGKITMHGRIGALIELGAGFNPILTGRENIYNNGAVLGFSKKEIDAKYDAIVAFAEMDEFIDMPVQNYSSGMKVRLGFAVASQMEPDVLLIDEVLAVGDIGFKVKCFNRITELLRNSAVVFVSHAMPQIARICSEVKMMEHGKSSYIGRDIGFGISLYQKGFKNEEASIIGNGITIGSISINNIKSKSEYDLKFAEKVDLTFEYENTSGKLNFFTTIVFMDANLNGVAVLNSKNADINYDGNKKGLVHVTFDNFLSPGKYSVNIGFAEDDNSSIYKFGENIVVYRSIVNINVIGGNLLGGIPIHLNSHWKLNEYL